MLTPLLLLLACAGDAPDTAVPPDGGSTFVDDGEVHLGFYDDDLFQPLLDGDSCWIINGVQGGYWTMPVVRLQGGLGELITITCSIDTAEANVGYTVSSLRFAAGPSGDLEYAGLPIPVTSDGDIAALYGLSATMVCTAVDTEQHRGSTEVSVVLEEGFDDVWSADPEP